MYTLKALAAVAVMVGPLMVPTLAQDSALDPTGSFVDEWGTTFTFSLCGDGTELCATLDVLEGDSATEENLAYVGSQVVQALPAGPSVWKGTIDAGGLSGETTITQTGPDTIDIEGCRAIVCQTLTYTRVQ